MNFSNYLQKTIGLSSFGSKFGSLTNSKLSSAELQKLSLFTSASLEQLQGLDLAKLLEGADISEVIGENGSTEDAAIANAIKSFLDLEEVQNLANTDGTEGLTEEEAMAFLQSVMGKDGDNQTFSIDDIDNIVKELGVDLETTANKAIEDAIKETDEKEVDEKKEDEVKEAEEKEDKKADNNKSASGANSTGSAGGGGGVGGGGSVSGAGSTGSASKSKDSAGETPEEIKAKIDEKNGEIDEIESQAEQEIEEQEKAKEDAMKQAGVSDEELKKYKEKEAELEKNITDTEKEISEQDDKITDTQATIESNKGYISSLESQISANENLKSGISKDDENASSRIAEIESKTQALKDEKTAKENENKKLEEDVKTAENKKAELEKKKEEYEKQKQELLNETLNNSKEFGKGMPNSEVEKLKENIASYDTKIAEIRSKKDSEVASIKGEIKDLEVKLKDAEEKEKRNEFLRENSANQGQSIIDLANSFDGKTQEEMRKIMQDAGYQFDNGAWCADFVSFIAGNTIGEENLPDWYKNCNRAYCPDIQSKAKQNGALVDVKDAQPGDAILFDWDGDGSADHIGYVVSVNDDGTVNTIEGNTSGDKSGSQVAYKKRNPGNILSCVKLT